MDTSRFKRRETQTVRNQKVFTEATVAFDDLTDYSQALSDLPENLPEATPRIARPVSKRPISIDGLSGIAAPVRRIPVIEQQSANAVTPIINASAAVVEPKVLPPKAPRIQHIPGFTMDLPGNESVAPEARIAKANKRRTVKTWALRSMAAVLVLLIGGGGLFAVDTYSKVHKVFKGTSKTVASLTKNVNPDLLKGEGDGRINVLLLGRGGGNHDGPDLTDTMLLDSIDPVNHTATEISIPRDLWVDVPGSGAMKINAAWETGEFKNLGKIAPGSTATQAIQAGFDQVDQTVESVLGVTVDYNVIVNFQAFQQAVDSIGGVTVNVPTDLIDPTMAWQNNNNPVLAKAGADTFSGSQALNYVRSRETTSDFARALRQRAVLNALKAKVDTLGTLSSPTKISGLLNAFGNNVATDMSLSDATRLYGIVKQVSDATTTSVGLADSPNNYVTTGNMDGQSIDKPTAGLFNYGAIQAFVRTQLPDGYLLKEHAKVLVMNGTSQSGVATAAADILKSYGYNVIGAAAAPTSGYSVTQVIDLSKGKDPYTRHYLEQRYNVTAQTSLPDSTIQNNGASFVVIIGSDEADRTKN